MLTLANNYKTKKQNNSLKTDDEAIKLLQMSMKHKKKNIEDFVEILGTKKLQKVKLFSKKVNEIFYFNIFQGDNADKFYFILKGEVNIYFRKYQAEID